MNSQSRVHVVPVNDIKEHVEGDDDCPCNPRVEYVGSGYLVVHNAWDDRELLEQAEAAMEEDDL